MFISMEGIDGCGKSLMTEKLCLYLKEKNTDFIRTREPGGFNCRISEEIRNIILHSADMDNRCEILLFLASRAQHVSEVIKPALEKGTWVISDRYADSFFAYQSFGREFEFEQIRKLNDFATGGLFPDITFYLKIDVNTSLARQTDPDRISSSDPEFFEKIKTGFDRLSEIFPDRIRIIDASQSPEKVFEDMINIIEKVRS